MGLGLYLLSAHSCSGGARRRRLVSLRNGQPLRETTTTLEDPDGNRTRHLGTGSGRSVRSLVFVFLSVTESGVPLEGGKAGGVLVVFGRSWAEGC